jgi:glycerate-2-kinase
MCRSRGRSDDGAVNAVRLRSGAGPEAADHLDRNDAYNFFKPLGDLVVP